MAARSQFWPCLRSRSRRDHREGERRRGRIGAQAQVGAEDIAVVGALLQDPQEIARQADEEVLQAAAAAIVSLVAS